MKKPLIIILALFTLICLGGGAFIFWRVWQQAQLPVYVWEQIPHGEIVEEWLINGQTRYLRSMAEVPLEAEPGGALIGRTSDGLDIRAVPGNDQYVVVTGMMLPGIVYRLETSEPFRLETQPITEIRCLPAEGINTGLQTTQDTQLIQEIVEQMTTGTISPLPPSTFHQGQLQLISADLPGIAYMLYLQVDQSGAVFLSPVTDPDKGIPAGPELTQWVLNFER